jgi:hypothetical protein
MFQKQSGTALGLDLLSTEHMKKANLITPTTTEQFIYVSHGTKMLLHLQPITR